VEPGEAFGIVLRRLRKKLRYSQEVLAFHAGIDRKYVSLLELGQSSASLNMTFKLANALGIKVSDFMVLVEEVQEMTKPRRKSNK
jgi:transcriptional regulator with XRE-family HTH domain